MDSSVESGWRVWREAASRPEIDAAIRALYREIGEVVAERRPVCNASGRCCRFEAYGHRLYVTGLEIAWFLQGVEGGRYTSPDDSAGPARAYSLKQLPLTPNLQILTPNCPYQINGLCSTHAIRPLGCRVFFCEEGTEAWQQDTTEHFLNRLKQLHADNGLPYAYIEWRAGLAEAHETLDDLM